ncbi:MAG: prepilin-type N-terminal cleavage/methylation domain-containing protein [bacterium]|nr:prepilin-type N-terminal cleavage/methylation domain-containing protein [bacterium]
MNYGKEKRLKELRHTSVFILPNSSQRGFSLVEMLFYIAILSLALLVVTQTLVVLMRSYGVLRGAQHIEEDVGGALDRMVREIRDANGVDDAGSVLGTHPGKLLLNTTTLAGAPRTVEFSLSAGQLLLKENGVVTGFLTSSSTSLSSLIFRKITSVRSKGVKIEMTMQSGTSTAARSENFYSTAVLRDSY